MCDTLSTAPDWSVSGYRYFAKNSDRQPGEPQILQALYFDEEELIGFKQNPIKEKYICTSFKYLEQVIGSDLMNRDVNYLVLISKPVWMWGGEIGVNEKGLSIGNEAVFSRRGDKDKGLLGMDILRLALHQCATAEQALHFISRLVATFGQGGDGGYHHSIFYDNAFLIEDGKESWILETSEKEWSARKSSGNAVISNTYSLGDNYDLSNLKEGSKGFKPEKEKVLMNFLAAGEPRNQYKKNFLKNLSGSGQLIDIKSLLRSHMTDSNRKKRGMKAICMHYLPLFDSQTTASLVVEYRSDSFVIWYTGSDFPCVSLYKPLVFDRDLFSILNLTDREACLSIQRKRQRAVRALDKMNRQKKKALLEERDVLEDFFAQEVDKTMGDRKKLIKAIGLCHRKELDFYGALDSPG